MNIQNQNFIVRSIINLTNFCSDKFDDELWPSGPTGHEYLNGLVRHKGDKHHRGSYVNGLSTLEKTFQFLMNQNWYEFTPDCAREGCRYFAADVLESRSTLAYIGVTSLDLCRKRKWAVVKRQGEHGSELITHSDERIKTNRITIIVEDGMMSTWHPGNPMPETPKEIPDDPSEWNKNWPVKLV